MNLGRFAWVGLLAAGAICPAASRRVAAQETADYFRQNCTSCHTIGGGRLTGPDLKDVEGRKDSDWLEPEHDANTRLPLRRRGAAQRHEDVGLRPRLQPGRQVR